MKPRLKSSKKSTAFPPEYSEQIEKVFRENFADQLGKDSLVVEGRIYSSEVMLRVGLRKKGELRQANFEVSMDYSPLEKDALERIHNCVDAAASMMMEYFEKQAQESEESDVDLPYIWREFPLQGKKIYLQFTTENSELEAEADKLLGIDRDKLVTEEPEEEEDALLRADETIEANEDELPANEEETEEEKSPRMFGGLPQKAKKKKKEDLH